MTRHPIFPSEQAIYQAIKRLHDAPHMATIHATGAGLEIPHILWTVPGSSRTIVRASTIGDLTYMRDTTSTILHRRPNRFVSNETAICLATRAFESAKGHIANEKSSAPAIGLGLTAVVESDDDPNTHEVYAAVRTEHGIWTAWVVFPRGHWSRVEEGRLCALLGINLMMHGARLPMIDCFSAVTPKFVPTKIEASSLILDQVHWPDGTHESTAVLDPKRHAIYPGSYDPITFGHEGAAGAFERASSAIGERKRVVFLINTSHPDKENPPLNVCAERAEQFIGKWPVVLNTQGPRYIDMAKTFPGFSFLLGVDTLLRLLDPKYYQFEEREAMFRTFADRGTHFYVTGRTMSDGNFRTLRDAEIPPSYLHLFTEVKGRWDISSTAHRLASSDS